MSEVTTRGLTLRYIVALGLIAVLTIISHFVLAETLLANEGAAAIINRSGRQRMLSQRISGLSVDLHQGNEASRSPLEKAIGQFEQSHARLIALARDDNGATIAERRLHDVYFGNSEVDNLAFLFLSAARRVAARPAGQHSSADAEEKEDLRILSDLSRGPLLSGLEEVVTIHQSVSEGRSQRMMQIQWAILVIVLLTLAFEACFIFRPMVRSISNYVGQLLRLADRDYLTGLLNRRAFTRHAETEIQRSRRYGRRLSLLMIDVDHFKHVNDTYGHLVGDSVLVAISQIIESQARREDLVGRIGGEEFAILLPEIGLAGAIDVADRLRQAVSEAPIDAGSLRLDVSISVGVAEVDLDALRVLFSAMSNADRMLYRAKDAGRNCVRPHVASLQSIRAAAG